MTALWDCLWHDLHLVTLAPTASGYGIIEEGALAITGGKIAWIGPARDLPGRPHDLAKTVVTGDGHWMTPGLIDCHTHLIFAGSRVQEWAMRLNGVSYEAIARAGGGINATVMATRNASEADLVESALPRITRLMAEGVTTIEIKSGYGLETQAEITMLRAARQLGALLPIDIRTTFLGAHAIPPEFAGDPDGFITYLIEETLPALLAAGLADAADAFCESIAFSPAQTARLFLACQALGLPLHLHADQLSDLGGGRLAARFGALSADHLECLDPRDAPLLKQAGTVAVLLPGANFFLGEERLPPVAALRAAGVPMAIATNCNPGSAPVVSLLLMLAMACTRFRLTPLEALLGVTRHAAQALGLDDRGSLAVGLRADLALWDITHPDELSYWMGHNPCMKIIQNGVARSPFSHIPSLV